MLGSIRSLRRSRGYTALVIGTLAVALGLATVVFGAINAILRPASPYEDGERLFTVRGAGTGLHGDVRDIDRLRAVMQHVPALQAASLAENGRALIESGSLVGERNVLRVQSDFFAILGATPRAGRFFHPADTLRTDNQLAVVSDGYWRGALGGKPIAHAASINVDGSPYTIVGVAPPGIGAFAGADVWLLTPSIRFEQSTVSSPLVAFVRLTPLSSRISLERDLGAIAKRLESTHGSGRVAFRFIVLPLLDTPVAMAEIHFALIAAAAAILIIACANLANLALARAFAMRSTFALRRALGARRSRIVRDVIAECALLSLCGGAVGALVVLACVGPLRRLIPSDVPHVGILDVQIDWVVFAFALGTSLVTAVAFGALPALRASSADPASVLKEAGGAMTARRGPYYSVVVVVQIALALAMATSAGLLLRASARVASIDFGYDHRGLVQANLYLPRRLNPDSQNAGDLFDQLQEGVRRLPGVSASTWWASPRDGGREVHASHDGTTPALYNPMLRSVPWDYLSTLGIAVLEGRDFLPGDREGPDVAVIDEQAARQLWPYESAIGRQLSVAKDGNAGSWMTVIGVAKRVRHSAASFDAYDLGAPAIYLSTPAVRGGRHLMVRTAEGNEARMLSLFGAVIRDVAPRGTYAYLSAFSDEMRRLTSAHRFLSGTFVALALCALALCVLGLYSVLSYAVMTRSREYAVRLAIGGTPGQILRLVVREGAVLVLGGTALGAFLSFAVARFVDPFLYDVYKVDPASLVAAECLVLACAFIACIAPAVRARRTSPALMLRAT